jgi:hypothetical protein
MSEMCGSGAAAPFFGMAILPVGWGGAAPMPGNVGGVAACGAPILADGARKRFFFEKKNQKTFAPVLSHCGRLIASTKKTRVFCFFFSKKKCLPGFTLLPWQRADYCGVMVPNRPWVS